MKTTAPQSFPAFPLAAAALLSLVAFSAHGQGAGESTAALIERITREMTQPADVPPRRTPTQVAQSCGNGNAGMVRIHCDSAQAVLSGNSGPCRWTAPSVAAGQARGWVVERIHVQPQGADQDPIVTLSYELVVRLAPNVSSRGTFGSIALIAVETGASGPFSTRRTSTVANIGADARPSYHRVTRTRTGQVSEVERPIFTGYLQPLHEWRHFIGTSMPAQAVEIYMGYGRISAAARAENTRRANANQTLLPGMLSNLVQQRDIMRERPDMRASVMGNVCRGRQGQADAAAGSGGDLALLMQQNEAIMRELCAAAPANDPIHSVCAMGAAQSARAAASAQERAGRIAQTRTQIGRPSAARNDPEMDSICAAGDFERLISRWERDARIATQDMENMGRAELWHLRAAMEDGGANSTCWSTMQWTPPPPQDSGGGN